MSKKISVLGVSVDNYSVEEAMVLIDEYLKNDYMNTIGYVTEEMLIVADENPEVKVKIENLDMTVIGKSEILDVAGITDPQRIQETEEDLFIKEFIRHAAEKEESVYILSENLQIVEEIEHYFERHQVNLEVVGSCVIESGMGDDDRVINEINSYAPDIIMAFMESPFQEEFVFSNKGKLCSKVWLGMGMNLGIIKKKNWLVSKVGKELFRRKVAKFNSRCESDS
ncbi:WecB/TagA/CpsF family glycosyltransferase [Anaerobium acetethylicum]|uniref:UDP-N-acetyl-D-mannosaminuronic acid transferase, WecB/TagA/CpsF family n=1 Tax=Anaerobium acetethylicum TaxID=1619234 RepID=A0A1D3TQ72_9FIRM|nr:WecB/TagA/CpsF family glycosyltransferase [Anaerobium acetethylicum]SCP95680.1 UDP-N-acetyl-D-mannosaminuronic acid transferase, WecB/TagA/CpsF family [Anaerobium acetethylicum]